MSIAQEVVRSLQQVQQVARSSDTYTKFAVRNNHLYVDHAYQTMGTVGRHLCSRVYTGYSRVDVHDFFAVLIEKCTEWLHDIIRINDSPYTYNNFTVYSIVSDELRIAMPVAGTILDTVPFLLVIVTTLQSTYTSDERMNQLILRISLFIEHVHTHIQPFYTTYVDAGYNIHVGIPLNDTSPPTLSDTAT